MRWFSLFIVVAACGESTQTGNDGAVDAPVGSDGSNPDVVSPTDAPSDSPVANDATSDAGGPISNPGKISCGKADCTIASNEICCGTIGFDGGIVVTLTCTTSPCTGSAVACDEKADCTTGVCCLDTQTPPEGSCKPSCGSGETQLCKSTTECASGTCKLYNCTGGSTTWACSQPLGCS